MPPVTVTLSDLISAAISHADETDSDFISTDEWVRWANTGMRQLYDILVKKNEDYFEAETTIPTVSGTDTYALPADFFKVLGVDRLYNGKYVTMQPYPAINRNQYDIQNSKPIWYRVIGDNIRFRPIPSAVDTIRVRYVVLPEALVSTTQEDLPASIMSHYSDMIVWYMVVMALEKDGRDARSARGQLEYHRQLAIASGDRNIGDPQRVALVEPEYMGDPWFPHNLDTQWY